MATEYGTDSANRLGASWADTFVGYGGDDFYSISKPDYRIIEQAGGGTDSVNAYSHYTLPANVENLSIGAWGATGIGNSLPNQMGTWVGGVTLNGMGGNDVYKDVSSGQSNIFAFQPGSGSDIVQGFDATGSDHDFVQLKGYGISDFSQARSRLSQVGNDVVLQLSGTDRVTFQNTRLTDFDSSDFFLEIDTSKLTRTFNDDFNSLSLWNPNTGNGVWKTNWFYGNQSTSSSRTAPHSLSMMVDPSYKSLGLNPFSVSDGVVNVRTGTVGSQYWSALDGYRYTSGMLSTEKTFTQTYGYFEIRMQLDDQKGTWPNFWLLPAAGGIEPEIDIAENTGEQSIFHVIHTVGDAQTYTMSYVPDFDTKMHTYGLLWTPEKLTFYVDGVAVSSQPTPSNMHQPMYMMYTNGVGGRFTGNPDADFTESNVKIDYIRAYSLEPNRNPSSSPTPTPSPDTSPSILNGTAGDDDLHADFGSQTINAGWGNDTLDAGRGDNAPDTMTGGAGSDTFLWTWWSGTDTITDFGVGDVVDFSDYMSAGLVPTIAASGSNTIIDFGQYGDFVLQNVSPGELTRTATGVRYTGGSGTISGTNSVDRIFGTVGNEIINAGAGNDYLNGLSGDDVLTGGGGNDTFDFFLWAGHDTITDFGRGDAVRLASLYVEGIRPTISDVGDSSIISFGQHGSVTIQGVNSWELSWTGTGVEIA